jgi:hypothetical protein
MATVHDSSNTIALDICQAIENGLFTPFLGAGASSLRTRNGYAAWHWVDVARQLRCLLDEFGEKSPPGLYLKALADAKGITPAPSHDPPSRAQWAKALLPLQRALTDLGAYLLEQCGTSMASTRKAIVDVATYEVPLAGDPDVLLQHLIPALDTALDLCGMAALVPDSDLTEHLNPSAIHKGLERLTLRLLGPSYLDSVRSSLESHDFLIKEIYKAAAQHPKHGSLSLDEATWLANLLWHTLRFEVNAYPTASELAFRISLEVDLHPHYAALAQAAQAWRTSTAQAKMITKWLDHCEDSPELTRFHNVMAAALALQHSRLGAIKAMTSDDLIGDDELPSSLGGAQKSKRPATPPVSLAITTNYDQCLERAFDRLRRSYHVIFPVNDAHQWLVRTVSWYERGREPLTKWAEIRYRVPLGKDVGILEVKDSPAHKFKLFKQEGPIVVKIHGSPQDVAPPSVGRFNPFLVLSERTYLDSVSSASALPSWIQQQIGREGREIWFLGYSISDWNVRLTLYRQVQMTKGQHVGPDPKKHAVDRRVDEWGMPLMRVLEVEMYEGDLEELGNIIRADTDVADYIKERQKVVGAGL